MKLPAPRPSTHRNRSRWLSLAAGDRERLAPPWIILVASLLASFGLILIFPHQTLERRLNTVHGNADELRIDYLQLWLRARPADTALRRLLLRQLIEAGRYAAARVELSRLESELNASDHLLLELDLGTREAYSLPASDPRQIVLLDSLRERIDQLSRHPRAAPDQALLAEAASRVGATAAAVRLHARLLAKRADLSAGWWVQAAQRMAALGQPQQAAALYLHAQSIAQLPSNRRQWLIDALRTLQAAGRLDEALAAAHDRVDAIGHDRDTLLFLTRLALAAQRPALAQNYATQLVGLNRNVHGQTALTRGFDDEAYTLAYQTFTGNGRLTEAKAVAAAAVSQAPRQQAWRERLAQTADWTGDAPLALAQWRAMARQNHTTAAWAEVERRAPQVRDHAAWLEALLPLQARQPTRARARAIVTAFDLMGEPEAAIQFLTSIRDPDERLWALETRAALEANLGLEEERAQTLRHLIAEFGANPARATELAIAEFARGRTDAAWTALQSARAAASGQDADYWTALAQLAQWRGDRDETMVALRHLIASDAATESHSIDAVNLLGPDQPGAAARLAEQGWQRWHTPFLAAQALALFGRSGELEQARRFLASIGTQPALEAEPGFLAARAYFHLAAGEPKAALAEARRGLVLQPGQADLVALLLWSAVAAHDSATTRATLKRYATLAEHQPALWPAWSAGWLALTEPQQALPWLRRAVATARDPLTWLTYADALDQLGQDDLAWRTRRHAWLALRADPTPWASAPEIPARLLALAPLFESGDAARSRLRALLTDRQQAGTREAALSWFLGREQNELAQAWMLARYAHQLSQPAWAELSIALGNDDRDRIAHLLDTAADWLPAADRVQGAQRVRRADLAQNLAFDLAERRPGSDTAHTLLTETLLDAPVSSGATVESLRQWPLETRSTQVHTGLRPTPHTGLRLAADERQHATQNTAILATVPAHDRELIAVLGVPFGDAATARWQLNARSALHDQAGAALELERPLGSRLRASASAQWQQRTDENAYLSLGGARNRLAGSLQWQVSARDYLSLNADASHYITQTGAAIGRGHSLRVEAGTSLRAAYPDLGVRLWWLDQNFSASGAIDPSIAPLVPAALRHLDARLLLPASSQQLGLSLTAGASMATAYTRAWRPWGEVSVYRDSVSGLNTTWALGIAGTLLGSDRLALAWAGGTATASNPVPYRRLALSWQWFH
ncbi:MAG: tetratricopeptide repeat protein [Burkholderiaceae bacterium]